MSVSSIDSIDRRRAAIQDESADLRKTGIHPDHWYPLARSRDLKAGKPLPVRFAGDPIVLIRPREGDVFALEDRCAHRQVPLHLGVVRGQRLQCSYHCWTYDRSGHCVNVPYLDKGKTLPNGVRSYPCREAYGLVFVFPGDPEAAETAQFPDIPEHAKSTYKTRYLDRDIACHYSFMHENLMDMNHQFLHRSLMGRVRPKLLDIREGDGWVEADYTFTRTSGKQHLGEKFIIGNRPHEPDETSQDLMTIRTGYPYQTLTFRTAGTGEPALSLWNVYVPVDREQRINHTYGMLMLKKPGIPGLTQLLWPLFIWFTEGIFGQDRHIVEEEQKAFDAQGEDRNQEIFPVILKLRALLIEQGVPLDAR